MYLLVYVARDERGRVLYVTGHIDRYDSIDAAKSEIRSLMRHDGAEVDDFEIVDCTTDDFAVWQMEEANRDAFSRFDD